MGRRLRFDSVAEGFWASIENKLKLLLSALFRVVAAMRKKSGIRARPPL
jgi:hypothetical protein